MEPTTTAAPPSRPRSYPLTRRFLASGLGGGAVFAVALGLLTGLEVHDERFEERQRVAVLLADLDAVRAAAAAAPEEAARLLTPLPRAYGVAAVALVDPGGAVHAAAPPAERPRPEEVQEALHRLATVERHADGTIDLPRYSYALGQRRTGAALRTALPLEGRPPRVLLATQDVRDLATEAAWAGVEAGAWALGLGVLLVAGLALWVRRAEAIIERQTAVAAAHARALAAANGELEAVARELEERVEARTKQLLQAETLARLGTLSAGVAHEINNPVASIATCAEGLLRRAQARGSDAAAAGERERLEIIRDEAFRVQGITRNLLSFARGTGRPALARVDLGAVLEDTRLLLSHRLKREGKTLRVEVAPGVASWGDEGALRQVALNLTLNALYAIGPGGEVRWRVAPGASEAPLVLLCEDDGPGFSERALAHALEPFYTEKPVGEGSGLGLSIVFGLVAELGGAVRLENRPEGGARVRVELPRVAGGDAPAAAGAAPRVARGEALR